MHLFKTGSRSTHEKTQVNACCNKIKSPLKVAPWVFKRGRQRSGGRTKLLEPVKTDADCLLDAARTGGVRAYLLMREEIMSGAHSPGQKLRIEMLKDRYDMSVGPLREAMSRQVSVSAMSRDSLMSCIC